MASPDPAPTASILDALSPSQREAASYTEGHLLVLAGAGSGKTRMLTHRIAYLLLEKGVEAHRILAVTFTNKAAREMRERVTALLREAAPNQPPPPNLWVSTFHALGARLLRRSPGAAGLEEGFTIFDDTDQKRVVRRIYKQLGVDSQRHPVGGCVAAIGTWKSSLLEPDAVAGAEPLADARRIEIYRHYQRELEVQNAVDFADLIRLPVRMLAEDPELGERYRRRFRYLMVDEYQDTNRAQYLFVRRLMGEESWLCAVGDEDQSIYGWRGADIRNILDFQEDFPEVRVHQLETNYRCPNPVLEAANKMIAENSSRMKEREVWSDKKSGAKPRFFQAPSAEMEAAWVAYEISYLRLEECISYEEMAVFYRTHAQARVLEQGLRNRGIPYNVFGGTKFFERRAIKDLVCYLRLLVNPRDRDSLIRVINEPKRGIGPKKVTRLLEVADARGVPPLELLAQGAAFGGKAGKAGQELAEILAGLRDRLDSMAPVETLQELVNAIGYRAHLQHIQKGDDMELVEELENAIVDYQAREDDPSLQGFLEDSALVSPTDDLDPSSGRVSLMTLHNAKGLEFPVVFVTGLEKGLLPHGNTFGMQDELEEERRLFYVGMTRTKQRLHLSCADFRTLYGKPAVREPSQFLEEIGEELLDVGATDL